MKKLKIKSLTFVLLILAMASLSGCRSKNAHKPLIGGIRPAEEATLEEEEDIDADNPEAQQRQERTDIVRYELPAPVEGEIRLERKGYTTSYNPETRCPNWVAWHLTRNHTHGSNQRSKEQFREDYDVKSPRATLNDYYNSRYDRGHMCPAADNKWDKEALSQTFLLTNICPQNHGLNKYEWNDLEISCRSWAYEYGAIDIVCGPIYYADRQPRTIGRNAVWVPDAFFKVILCRQNGPKAIGFIFRNEGKKQLSEDAVCTVDYVESITGYDFFHALDDAVEAEVEAMDDLSDW